MHLLPPTIEALPRSGPQVLQLARAALARNTDDMTFDVAIRVPLCSDAFELQPGDILISGTPAGVGFARKPPLFVKRGDRREIEVEGAGLLANIVA